MKHHILCVQIFVFAVATGLLCAALATAQGPPGGFKKGKGPDGFKGGKGGPGGRFAPEDPEQDALDKLKLTGSLKDKAQRLVDSHTRATGRMLDRTRQELLKPLKELLTIDQYLAFQDGLNTRRGGVSPVSVNDMIERVLACDKNNRGMVAKEDLPERMQHLVALGDTNKDGYLDRDEIKQMAIKLSQQGRGPNQGRAFTPADAERSMAKLALTGEPKDKAGVLLDTYKQATRTISAERRDDLVIQMKDILSETQLKLFKDTLESRVRRAA
jgi:hypothetical protein